ncbi:MAG: cytochrome c biogenesis protein ResB [Dehalococcoidia bacterium]
MTVASRAPARSRRPGAFDPFAPVWRTLTSVRFAVSFIATLALFGLLGVVIPQIPEAMRGNTTATDAWVEAQRGTFGPLTEPMHRFGIFNIFHARWFLVALGFLVLNVTVCTFNRWSPTFHNVFRPPKRVPDSFFERAHNRVELAAAPVDRVEHALRRLRFRIDRTDESGATYVFADRYPWTQLSTFVSHLALILFIAGGLVTALTGFTSDAFAGEGTTVPVFAVKDPNQLQVRVDDAIGVYGERGNPLDFRTHLTIFQNGEEVKSGTTTVNNPLEYGGYRFHQVAYWADGVELRIRDLATGNTVLRETFPLEDTTAAPRVTITDAADNVLLTDVIAPTDFLQVASGALVAVPGTDRIIWIGLTAPDDERWQVVAFDPQAGAGAALRIDEGANARFGGLNIRFENVTSLPSAVGIGVPGGEEPLLAQLVETPNGHTSLMLVGSGRPAISLAEDDPTAVDGYEYTFEGQREFAGISVKRDSGAWFIWIATGMLVIGLAVTFYVPRRRLWLKLTPESTYIAALAEKSGGFEKDMRILAQRIGVPVPPQLEEER